MVILLLFAGLIVTAFATIQIVPQQQAWIVERFGKFERVLEPGLSLIVPIMERIAYKHSLKEHTMDVHAQTAISKDNVTLSIDGVLYTKVLDPVAASYGVTDPYYAISQLAQTTMRSEIGKMKLDGTFAGRENLNLAIVGAINTAAKAWGMQCMRYEIKDIHPPKSILEAMELEVAAERQKRARILESEGARQSQINVSEGEKEKALLESEGAYIAQVNQAKGEAEAILLVANATAKSVSIVAEAINGQGGPDAVSMKVAEQYIEAFAKLASQSNTIMLPSNLAEPASMVAQALAIFENVKQVQQKK